MSERKCHPKMLDGFEVAPARVVQVWVGIWLVAWLLFVTIDWALRFTEFRWQDTWLPQRKPPAGAPASAETIVRTVKPAQTGAGLTQMMPFSAMASRYAEFHPETIIYRDSWGYQNSTIPEEEYCPVVIVGDSFMVSLGTQTLSQVLSSLGDVRVYNHARPAAGPFNELRRLIQSDRFVPTPKVVAWNLSARELGESLFKRQAIKRWFAEKAEPQENSTPAAGRILWDQLTPANLRKSWPNTSLAAYFSRRIWQQLKLLVFREWPSDVLGADDPQFGPMLFYGENLKILSMLTPETDAQMVVSRVSQVAQGLRARGIELVVLLVPEKEQVHAQALPEMHQQNLANSIALLEAIELGLASQQIAIVNLLPVFQKATASGQRLYWRDDTHWNDAGIRIAAEELWRVLEPMLK